jgi:hypothetical protein
MMDRRRFKYRVAHALLLALLSGVPSLARNVECPAVWPGDSSKSKVKEAYAYIDAQTQLPWEQSKHGTRVEGVVYGEYVDLQYLYDNGRTLFFPLHGEEKKCHEIIMSPPYGDIIYIRTYCKLNAHDSADPAQGPFIVAELLTRHSDVLGFRLDMSRAEIEAAIDQSGGSGVERDGEFVRAELSDGRKVSVQFAPDGRIRKIVIDSFGLPEHDFYHRLLRRFGLPSDLRFSDWTGIWKGADGATIEIDADMGVPGHPHVVGGINTAAPQQVRLFDAAAK